MRTNILNPDAFTELLHLSDMLGQNCLFSTVTWLLLCFLAYSISAITVFGSDSSKPEINCGPKDITPNIVSSKHHHFKAPLNKPFIYSSLKHSPLKLAYPPRSCVQAIYTSSINLSSSLLLPATPQPIFCSLTKNNSGIKIGTFTRRSIFQTTVFQRRDQYSFNVEAREKKKPFCYNFTNKYREYSFRNTKDQGGERGDIFLIALVLNNIGNEPLVLE